jgi:hypothetical protein
MSGDPRAASLVLATVALLVWTTVLYETALFLR